MSDFLARYHAGAYEQVWAELVALGPQVRDEAILPDAWAVTQETMRRARTNIETIVNHLEDRGYQFEAKQPFEPPDEQLIAEMGRFEQKVGPLPLSVRAWIEIVGTVDLMGTYPGLSYYHPQQTLWQSRFMVGGETMDFNKMLGLLQNSAPALDPSMLEPLNDLLQSLSGWQQMSQMGRPNQPEIKPEDQVVSDPLVVWMSELESWEDMDEPALTIAPDADHKANISGGDGYEIRLPDPAADVPLLYEPHKTTFVNYLRIAFRWGGFPGLEGQDKRAATYLKDIRAKLLPL